MWCDQVFLVLPDKLLAEETSDTISLLGEFSMPASVVEWFLPAARRDAVIKPIEAQKIH